MAVVRYTNANGRLIAEKRNGVRSFYMADGIGSTRALLNSSQTKTDTFTYWPYGEIKTSTGSTPTPFKFVGCSGWFTASTRVFVNPVYDPRFGGYLNGAEYGIRQTQQGSPRRKPLPPAPDRQPPRPLPPAPDRQPPKGLPPAPDRQPPKIRPIEESSAPINTGVFDESCCETPAMFSSAGKCCNCSSIPIIIKPENPPPKYCTLKPGKCHDCDGVVDPSFDFGAGNVYKVSGRCALCMIGIPYTHMFYFFVTCAGWLFCRKMENEGGIVPNPGFPIPRAGEQPPDCK